MKALFTHVLNRSKQYTHRIFYACTNNTLFLHYSMLFSAVSALDSFITTKIRGEEPSIVLISNNILFKIIVFTYCFFTGSKLLMVSPKFNITEISNTILSKRGINIFFADKQVISDIQILERQEGINILSFFTYIETTLKMLELLLEHEYINVPLSYVSRKERVHHLLNNVPGIGILSPGTTSESSITSIPYELLGKSMVNAEFFMGLKPGDKVSVIADFEFYPGIYTILGLLTGVQLVLPETDKNMTGEEIRHMFSISMHKPNVIFISSNNFKKIWDSIILNVYSRKIMFFFAKYGLTKWIVNYIIRKELYKTFGKNVKKVHILNEELGFTVLDILSKIPSRKFMVSSSYGFLEQGNFLAFKDPEVFKHNKYIYKPGGTVLKDLRLSINREHGFVSSTKLFVGEINLLDDVSEHITKTILSNDVGLLMENVSNQGDRKFLYVYGKEPRHSHVEDVPSLDMIEKSIKDTWLIRDCLLLRYFKDDKLTYKLYVEVREDLIDAKLIKLKRVEDAIKALAIELHKHSDVKISYYGIINFNGMRNIAEKLKYYNM